MTLCRITAVLAALALGVGFLTACSSEDRSADPKTDNTIREVDERFGERPQVVPTDPSGVDSSTLFFESSETAVVSGPTEADQLRAASLAVTAHSPVLRYDEGLADRISQELDRLGATTVVIVGGVDLPPSEGRTIIQDPATPEAFETMTTLTFAERPVATPGEMASAVADLNPQEPAVLVPEWTGPVPPIEGETEPPSFPVASNRDAGRAPVVVASPLTSPVDVANARAWGASVEMLPFHDVRATQESLDATAGLADGPLVALGSQFGSGELLSQQIRLAETTEGELPGGGQLLFPGRRMVALYGSPITPALGVMGERSPEESVAFVQDLVSQYEPHNSAEPVVPAFEIIATVASSEPGADGNFSNEFEPEVLQPYVDAIVDAGGYAVLDLQPGRASFLEQAQIYEEILKHPHVGLALDPEWVLGPDDAPGMQVGSTNADAVNEVAEWLAQLTRDNNLPQKALVVHQFQLRMLPDREQINTAHPELSFVLHADGHGDPETKMQTWNVMRQDLGPDWFLAWKNFYDEDKPTFSPEQTYAVEPRPWFVSYQ